MTKLLKKTILVSAASLFTITASAQLSTNTDKFLGNITTGYRVDVGNGVEDFYKLWNQITCENESKWDAIEPQRGNFTFGNSDRAANYAKQHGFPFKYHTLIWGGQYPSWMNSLSTSEQTKAIEEYFKSVHNHYPNLELIDVVNEAISGHNPAPYKAALGGDGITGYDWIIKAFEMAHELWPDAILIYNDYNTFQWNTDQFIDLVRTIRDAGAPIDAYGCQSHDMLNQDGSVLSLSSFKASMDKLHNALMMPMYSTEYDVGTTNDDIQLKAYSEQIPYMWEQDYCAGITLWGYIYGSTWTTDGNSGIIKNGKDRPAMTWLREYMASDKAKSAKSPFPGMKKEASVYVKPASIKVTQNDVVPINIRARLRTKTIDHIDFYIDNVLYKTFTADEPYKVEYTPTEKKKYNLKAVVVATDGTEFERLSSITAYEPRGTYKDQIAELPGTLQAENFDTGADGIAYHDSNSDKEGDGASYRSDGGIDVVKGNGGYVIGYTNSGEWMEYTVNVKEAGVYEYDAWVSSGTTNSSFSVSLINNGETTDLTPSLVVPQTGNNDWGKYVALHGRLSVPLEAGKQILRINITGSSCNIDKIIFNRIDVDKDIKVKATSDPSPATVNENATIKVDATSPNGDIKEVRIYLDNVLKTTLKASPFEYTYKPTQKGTFNYTVEAIDAEGKSSNLEAFSLKVNNKRSAYKGVISIPGIIEAENFDKGGEGLSFHDSDSNDEGGVNYRSDNEGVDIVRGNGGYAIGYTSSNDEWLEYSVDVKEAGDYEYIATASSGNSNTGFTLNLVNDGKVTQLCKVNVPNTGSWDTYKTITGKLTKKLEAGPQIFRIVISGAYCNIDKIELKCTSTGIDGVTIDDDSSDNTIYNLSGQKVNANYKGIIIQNGKKRWNK